VTVVDQTWPDAPTDVIVASGFGYGYVDMRWNPSQAADVIGYEIGYGPKSGEYPDIQDTTNVTKFRLPVAPSTSAPYLAVRAYDSSGHHSSWSPAHWVVYLPTVMKNRCASP
jgi:hypothetical protein